MNFILDHAILWPVAIPIMTAALAMMFWLQPGVQRAISAIGIVLMAGASLLLLATVVQTGTQAAAFGAWPIPFGIGFVADRFGAAMVAISGTMALAVMVFGIADIRRRQEHGGFHPLLHGMLAGVNGAFLTGDIFNLYVWFEIMLITAMGLLVIDRTRAQLDGTLKYAVLNLLGTLLFLLAVAVLYGATGTLNMADLAIVLPLTEQTGALAFSAALFLLAFGIKAGYFPMFFWLPAAYHTAAIPVVAIFSALLTKAGIYASFRVFTLLFSVEVGGIREIAAFMAGAGMLLGVFGAAVQWDMRRILAFHSVSQFGYMVLGLALATPLAFAGAIFYVIHHALVKSNLFLVAGAMYRASGTFDLRRSGGLMASHPMLALLFAVPALSLAGIPPLSGFWAKFMVIDASFKADAAWLAAIGLLTGLLTLFSMSKIWLEAFWKAPAHARKHPRRVPVAMLLAIGALGVATATMGIFPEPFIAYVTAAANDMVDPASYIDAVFGGGR